MQIKKRSGKKFGKHGTKWRNNFDGCTQGKVARAQGR